MEAIYLHHILSQAGKAIKINRHCWFEKFGCQLSAISFQLQKRRTGHGLESLCHRITAFSRSQAPAWERNLAAKLCFAEMGARCAPIWRARRPPHRTFHALRVGR
jgi:hypothetical protein